MQRWIGILIILGFYFAIAVFTSPLVPGPVMRDFSAYYAGGAAWDMHQDPYGTGIWNTERTLPGFNPSRQELLPFVNPPVTLPLFGLLAKLPFSQAATVWSFALALALLGLVLASLTLAVPAMPWWRVLIATAFGMLYAPVLGGLMLGQVALIAAPALTIAAWGYARSNIAGPIATVITALQPPMLLPLAGWFRRWRTAHTLLVSGAVYALIWIVLIATNKLPSIPAYLSMLREHGNAERFSLIQYTPGAIAYGFGVSPTIATAIAIIIAVIAISIWIVLVWKERDPVLSFAIACALAPFIIPFFHEHDFAMLFPAITIALFRNTKAFGWIIAAAFLTGINWVWLAQRPHDAVLIGGNGGALAVMLFLLARPKSWSIGRVLPIVAVFVLFVISAIFAQHGPPAAVWPQTMHAFTLPANASAATIWHAEQIASGALERHWLWAALRCLPFFGCAILVACLYLDSAAKPMPSEVEARLRSI